MLTQLIDGSLFEPLSRDIEAEIEEIKIRQLLVPRNTGGQIKFQIHFDSPNIKCQEAIRRELLSVHGIIEYFREIGRVQKAFYYTKNANSGKEAGFHNALRKWGYKVEQTGHQRDVDCRMRSLIEEEWKRADIIVLFAGDGGYIPHLMPAYNAGREILIYYPPAEVHHFYKEIGMVVNPFTVSEFILRDCYGDVRRSHTHENKYAHQRLSHESY